ncbi:MAG TPA: arginine deiminase family protein [Nocardioidaceae bacterium]|jgi:dimethylargininase
MTVAVGGPKILVRRPGPRLADGIVTHVERVPVDVVLAHRQWEKYVGVLEDSGWDPVEVPPADDCPDAVFVEDAVVVYRNIAVITRPGAPERRPEIVDVEKVVEALGYSLNHIHAPGTLDGGDVLKIGRTVYVGRGGRTNADGVRQLRAILQPLDATVVAVPVTKVLHLKSAVTALPDATVIGYRPSVDNARIFARFRAVPEESGAHVVLLGDSKLLMAADCPESAEAFADLGFDPVVVDISEFQKLEGCVTCLSVRLRATAA